MIKRSSAGQTIMKDEIQAAIRKIKLGKAANPDNISVEFLETLEDYEIDIIATLYPGIKGLEIR